MAKTKKTSNQSEAGVSVSAGSSASMMDKKSREAEIKKAVKLEQDKKREEALEKMKPKEGTEKKLSFDSWYSIRQSQIASHHRKEVLKADFSARGCGSHQTLKEWDSLLLEYGVKL